MKAMASLDLEYAWVVTTNPNQLLLFSVSTANSPALATITLPGEPIDLVVGVPHPVDPDAGTIEAVSGLVSVIIAQ
jgi:hypothetical protein